MDQRETYIKQVEIWYFFSFIHVFFYKKIFYKGMSHEPLPSHSRPASPPKKNTLKNVKKIYSFKDLPQLQFLKTLIVPRAF